MHAKSAELHLSQFLCITFNCMQQQITLGLHKIESVQIAHPNSDRHVVASGTGEEGLGQMDTEAVGGASADFFTAETAELVDRFCAAAEDGEIFRNAPTELAQAVKLCLKVCDASIDLLVDVL